MKELLKESKGAKSNTIAINKILLLIGDILWFFNDKNTKEYEINQRTLRIQEVFHRYIAKVWVGTNF